jgi:hypothetical protein
MTSAETYTGQERRRLDSSSGIQLRWREKQRVDKANDRRTSSDNGFDIAGALELHLEQVTTRRGMITLLESWLQEANDSQTARDENYVRAIADAITVMTAAPDPLTGIARLQRSVG